MKYDIKYNTYDDLTVEECFTNADKLKKYQEKENLTSEELQEYLLTIPGYLWTQFRVITWDDENLDASGIPELISSKNAVEWIYED